MKKLLIIALCATIPMVGFAQKRAKKKCKNAQEEVVAPVVEVLDDEGNVTDEIGFFTPSDLIDDYVR